MSGNRESRTSLILGFKLMLTEVSKDLRMLAQQLAGWADIIDEFLKTLDNL